MMGASAKFVSAGTRVRIKAATAVPTWSTWDDDGQRTSTPVKKRLQTMFFKGEPKVVAEIVYIARETERDALRRLGRVKVRLREPSGSCVVITAESSKLTKAR